MSQENGDTAPRLGVLEEIAQRLAALTPEQFIAPPMAREPDAHFVCMATDDIKRLFTLQFLLLDEHKALAVSGAKKICEAVDRLFSIGPREIAKELDDPGSVTLESVAMLRQVNDELLQKELLTDIVHEILRLEVRRQHPDLQTKPTTFIYSDWSLCWRDDADDEE